MAVRKIDHVGIMVQQLEPSIQFYEEVIGLKLKGTLLHTNGFIRLAFLGWDGTDATEVELVEGYPGSVTEEGRVHHIAFSVDDIEAELARIKNLPHVELIDEELVTLPNGSRYFFFKGPDGERLEFFQSTRN
ncbi:VOC family protein [Paenibacillus alvei]|uniref:VOC family protein n=1 Tax=Paenibacillus alvei TaxID=44250 RepID=A0AAP6ZYU1_PAEAL|nr:VOC family protein [Paenibacillus alvei]MBG9736781.1 glyoxalase [Paenibacillus alvei]MBG9746937.1 glyoxalase [Paenibacillus alvei]MCY9581960.1 VOC family protein [Paenibacillus alvei]MCY9585858.1 VOC family protein [Paenibacillus alvei]NEZ43571.1 VOC family protein [Paenibacillus alvei]